jgi:hypothetical protein
MAISHFSSCRMLPALHQRSCRLIQKGIPYANDKYTINLGRAVLPVSGGKSKFVSQSSRPEVTRPLTRIQCDETSPACLNCTKRKLQCSFRSPLEPTNTFCRRQIQTTTNSALGLVLCDRLSRKYSDIEISILPSIPTLGFGLQIQGDGNSVDLNRSSLEILNKHSRDHREVACAACFARAGMRIEESPAAVIAPSYSFLELAPKSTPAEQELLLYFERFTSKTLALSTTAWGTYLLKNTLQVRSSFHNLVSFAHTLSMNLSGALCS